MPIIPVFVTRAQPAGLGLVSYACTFALVTGYNGKRQIFFRADIDTIQAGCRAVILGLGIGFPAPARQGSSG